MNSIRVQKASGKFQQEITVGRHRLIADVDLASGGEDAGPSPHDLLASALGACTAITVQMYAQRKAWPVENVDVTVTLDKEGEVTKLHRKIQLIGALDQQQRERLLAIANQCPVHKTLSGKIEIATSLV